MLRSDMRGFNAVNIFLVLGISDAVVLESPGKFNKQNVFKKSGYLVYGPLLCLG